MLKKIIKILYTVVVRRFPANTYVHPKTKTKKVKLYGNNLIGPRCNIRYSSLGIGTYISRDSFVDHTKIGKYCSIGPYFKTIQGTHPTSRFVSTHPAFFSTFKQAGFTFVEEEKFNELRYVYGDVAVEIGNDVWIGACVTILAGVKIGDGAIIGAGSIVTKNVEPYSIVGGVPAKILKYRFDSNQITLLEKIKWWDRPFDWIRDNSNRFYSIDEFIDSEK